MSTCLIVSPSALLTVIHLSSAPKARRFWGKLRQFLICFGCQVSNIIHVGTNKKSKHSNHGVAMTSGHQTQNTEKYQMACRTGV